MGKLTDLKGRCR